MIKEIDTKTYVLFLHSNNARRKQVSINENGTHFGYYLENRLVGVISKLETVNTVRIKGFLVSEMHLGKGIGRALIQHLLVDNKTMSVFSTMHSRKLFIDMGFETISEKANGIAFMTRKATDKEVFEITDELKDKLKPHLVDIATILLSEEKQDVKYIVEYIYKELKKLK